MKMNERIRELLKQSRRQASEIQTPGSGAYENLVFEKFAELIVKECIEQCTANDSNDEWDKGVRWAANQIKQHFGVEE